MSDVFTFHQGDGPLLVSVPHDGWQIPSAIVQHMTGAARGIPDTDWHVSQLYDFVRERGASMLVANFSRYVIDLNRPPDGEALYPGRDTTELCPTSSFHYEPLYREGCEPDAEEIARRVGAGEEDFAVIAARLNDDPGGKERAGDLGWIHRGNPDLPLFLTLLFNAEPGTVSRPYVTEYGIVLLQRER